MRQADFTNDLPDILRLCAAVNPLHRLRHHDATGILYSVVERRFHIAVIAQHLVVLIVVIPIFSVLFPANVGLVKTYRPTDKPMAKIDAVLTYDYYK